MTTREAFEAFISAPPFEMPTERFDDRGAWPGGYTELEVDLAWQAWKASHDAAQAEIDRLQAQLVRQQASYEAEIKVEIDSALERAAVACEVIENERWALYKGRPPYTGTEPGRADNYVQGESGGTGSCASAIRALKDADKC